MSEIISAIAHVIGLIGMACVVLAFYMSVHCDWDVKALKFNVVNLTGAILLTVSLVVHFNLGSFVIELFWIAISISGILKARALNLKQTE